MRLTFKLLNPEDVIRVLEWGRKRLRGKERRGEIERERGWRSKERNQWEGLSDCVLRETVTQNDSAGLLFERLPACQFRCNIFIDTLLAATWQAGRSSTFTFHTRSSGLVKQVPLANFGGSLPFFPPSSAAKGSMQGWQCLFTWPRKSSWCNCAHIQNSQVIFDFIVELYTARGCTMYCISYLLHDLLLF